MTQAHIYYSGIVQGVGFRYTVQRHAITLGLCGWVRNLSDGRVEIIAEGGKETIKEFMDSVEKHFTGSIRKKDINYNAATGQYKDFTVRFTPG